MTNKTSTATNSPAILVVAPHHDDEVIGCGGTMALLALQGLKVDVLYMTAGYSGIPKVKDKRTARKTREIEARKSAAVLKLNRLIFWRYPDRELEYSLKVVRRLVRLIRKYRYAGLYFPHADEKDSEHQVVHRIVSEAGWLVSSPYFPELGPPTRLERLINYEVWTPMVDFNFVENISEVLPLKIEALQCFASQFEPDRAKRLVGLNEYRAALSNQDKTAVEAFKFHIRR
jgi:LmbE family N-acetylglucosaminyl deacetylase